MQRELVTLFARLHVDAPSAGPRAGEALAHALNGEAATFGYTFAPELSSALAALDARAFGAARRSALDLLSEVSGAGANHASLFSRFPYETPDAREYLVRRIMGSLQSRLGVLAGNHRVLSCGHVIDPDLFDLSDFGACPICQRQVPEVAGRDEARHPYRGGTPLKVLGLADGAFLAATASQLIARPSSLSADEKAFLTSLLGTMRPSAPASCYRETLPIAHAMLADEAWTRSQLRGATDVMRIATYMSDPAADLSLKDAARFRLSTAERKALLRMLEGLDGLEEDMMRRRERWLRLGEELHAGTRENRRRFPRVAGAFDRLRRDPGAIPTFSRMVDRHVRARRFDGPFLDALSARPGDFARRLDLMLREGHDTSAVNAALARVAPSMTTAMLLALPKHLQRRLASRNEDRVFVPKGRVNKLQVVPDRRKPLPVPAAREAAAILDGTLHARLEALPPMGRVWLDPALGGILVPFNRRGDSSTSVRVTKGSRYPLPAGEVVRLFVHWEGEIDVDLSILCFDRDLNLLQRVAWNSPQGYACAYSGDVQSAPKGASEFIDFEVASLRANGVAYVASSVLVYSGPAFGTFPCFAGYMERDGLKSGQRYEPKAVRLKYDVASGGRSHLPLVFDLDEGSVVFADVSSRGCEHGAVSEQGKRFVAATRAVLGMREARPTLLDLLRAHVEARGTPADGPGDADMRFEAATADPDAIAAEYLG